MVIQNGKLPEESVRLHYGEEFLKDTGSNNSRNCRR